MKKLLGLFVAILFLLGIGFVYLVKNPTSPISQKILPLLGVAYIETSKQAAIDPNCISYFDGCNTCMVSGGIIEGCTKMFCDTPTEPQCLEYKWTGMDLTNCVSYFDGCNTCTVKDGRPDACTLMYCETPGEPKCNEYSSDTDITDFQSCMDAGNPIMESYPRQCANNGTTYTEIITEEGTVCTMEAKLCDDGSSVGRTGPNCEFAPCPSEEPTACTMEYDPVCASVAIQCVTTPCDPIEQTFGNKCMMNANKLATFLHDGECTAK